VRYRKLRIAWSVVWGIACVLLCVLWSRSYWWVDQYYGHNLTRRLFVQSFEGEIVLGFPAPSQSFKIPEDLEWWGGQSILMYEHYVYYDTHVSYAEDASLFTKLLRPFRTEPHIGIAVPSWFVVGLSVALAVAPWIRHLSWRFSLRTLLVIMAVVALVMGLVLYAGRDPWFDLVQPE
jgi:hypothetical protein